MYSVHALSFLGCMMPCRKLNISTRHLTTELKLSTLSTDADVYAAWLRYLPTGALVGEYLSSMMSRNGSVVSCDVAQRYQWIPSLPWSSIALIRVQQLPADMDVHTRREERELSCSHTICNLDISCGTFMLEAYETSYI